MRDNSGTGNAERGNICSFVTYGVRMPVEDPVLR
jgi:hypothetical protein